MNTPKFEAIESIPTYMSVVNQIMEMVSRGELSPGQRLPTEEQMAMNFNVSRASVREALASLKLVGLLSSKPGLGHFIVANVRQSEYLKRVIQLTHLLSERNPLDILEAREAIEPEAARLAAQRRDIADLVRLSELLSECAKLDPRIDKQEHMDLDSKFHRTIAAATKNLVIKETVGNLHDQMQLPSWRVFKERDLEDIDRQEMYEQHHYDVLDAISKQQDERAYKIMKTHIKAIRRNFIKDGT